MSEKQIIIRKLTASEWAELNPILGIKEAGIILPSGGWKIGDGVSNWESLPTFGKEYADIFDHILAAIIAQINAEGTARDRYRSVSISSFEIPAVSAYVSFIIGRSLAYIPNQPILVCSATNSDKFFDGEIVSYNGETGEVTVRCTSTASAGQSFSAWDVNISGIEGPQGDKGADGATWRSGSGVPSNAVGADGDYYLNTTSGGVYLKSSGTYSVIANIRGPAGLDGAAGLDGLNGKTIYNGSGAPSNGLGTDGDFYIDPYNSVIYGPKLSGAWPAGVSLIGEPGPRGFTGLTGDKGDKGDTGDAGSDGATWRNGTGAPSNGLGADNDYYLDTSNYDVYKKTTGTYATIGNIKGAPGAAGAAGLDGKTLRNGAGAPSGALGVDGDFYIDTAANTIYGPKASGVWGFPISIIGPLGPAGAAGKTVLNGTGAPSGGIGVDGDFYIDTVADAIYGPKTAGAWGSATSLIGPPGPTGDAGPAGAGVAAGVIEIDFGSTPTNEASVSVTGQTGILTTSTADACIMARSTADNTVGDHEYAAIAMRFSCSEPTAGTGFTIKAFCIIGFATGKFNVNWRWS